MSYLYFTIGIIVGVGLCTAFPALPKALNDAIQNAKKQKIDNYTQHPNVQHQQPRHQPTQPQGQQPQYQGGQYY